MKKKGRCAGVSPKSKIEKEKQISLSNEQKHFFGNFKVNRHIPAGTPLHTCRASFTLEAAVLMPVFACFMVSILFYFKVLGLERDMKEALQYTGRTLAVSAFAEDDVNGAVTLTTATLMLHDRLKDLGAETDYLDMGIYGISLAGSDVSGDYVDLKAGYSVRLPITMFGKKAMIMSQEVKARKWNGDTGTAAETDGETYVYVTPSGSVYHMSRDCSYLDLSIRSVSQEIVGSERNKSGGKYYACPVCAVKQSGSGMVYITDYGDKYHTNISCSGLKRSVYMEKLSEAEAEGKRACSKCGGQTLQEEE